MILMPWASKVLRVNLGIERRAARVVGRMRTISRRGLSSMRGVPGALLRPSRYCSKMVSFSFDKGTTAEGKGGGEARAAAFARRRFGSLRTVGGATEAGSAGGEGPTVAATGGAEEEEPEEGPAGPGKRTFGCCGRVDPEGGKEAAATADRSALVGDDKRETSAEAARASSSSGGASEVDDMAM